VAPPINPHPFLSDEFEQDPGNSYAPALADVAHLSLVGGTPLFNYPEATTHLVQEEGGLASTPLLSSPGGVGTLEGDPAYAADPLHAGEGELIMVASEGAAHAATAGGDVSLPTAGVEEVTVDAEEVNTTATTEWATSFLWGGHD
jgi:hypothetical protein